MGSGFLLSESRTIADDTDDADYFLNRGFSRIAQMTRILRVSLFVVAQFIAPFSESRVITGYADDADYFFLNRGFSRISRISRIGTL